MINVLLDLDQTLISSELKEEIDRFPEDHPKVSKFTHSNMDDYYIVFERPHLQLFLDYLFSNFRVSVWTAASKGYALFIIKNHILKNHPERQLDNIFFEYHCKVSNQMCNNSKSLSMLWDDIKLKGYNENNTYIVDDNDSIWNHQPSNCIIAKDFEFFDENSEKDQYLLHLIHELDILKNSKLKDPEQMCAEHVNERLSEY